MFEIMIAVGLVLAFLLVMYGVSHLYDNKEDFDDSVSSHQNHRKY